MKFGTKLRKQLRSLAKRSKLITGLYSWLRFLKTISGQDLLNSGKDLRKTRLLFTVKPYTMMTYPRLSALYELACRFERAKTSGSFVECGVYNGGSAAIMAAVAKQNINRNVWLFDSWEGFPEPDERDFAYNLEQAEKGGNSGSEERVRKLLFSRLQLDSARVHLVKGWFADTLPRTETGKIALLHLDCDLYESVKRCLEQLYDDVIKGGCIVIDDYGYWKGCKEAVDGFIERRNLKVELLQVDHQAVYFYKES
jgi:O-methyltransferase